MKKLIFLVFALIIVCFTSACTAHQTEINNSQATTTVQQKNESLTIFCLGDTRDSGMLQMALEQYRALYPDVEVELIKPDYDGRDIDLRYELYDQVSAQIMAGEGPDVFLIDQIAMDIEKLVRQGVFADLEPFFEEDNFDWEPYNQAVMGGGVWNGKRFVIPLSYSFPLLFTTRTALEETGFDVDACKDYQGFLEETTRYMQDSTQTRKLFCKPLVTADVLEISGLSVADYDAKTIDLSSPVLRAGFEWYKLVLETHPDSTETLGYDGLEDSAAAVRDGKALWAASVLGAFNGFFHEFAALKTVDEAVMMPVRDVDGGIQASVDYSVAVRGNSENLQNAYNYIKILLGPAIQNRVQNGAQLSVLNSANEYGYQRLARGEGWSIVSGVGGFVSTTDPTKALDWPTQEEFEQLVGFTQEITGVQYINHLGLNGAMNPYVYENADYEETLEETRRAMEIYISE